MPNYFSIGEIHRLGLLKSYTGAPYKTKVSIRKAMRTMPTTEVYTPYGTARCLSDEQITAYNARWQPPKNV